MEAQPSEAVWDRDKMPVFSMFIWGTRRTVLPIAALMIGLIALIDAHVGAQIPLGFLYIFPMLGWAPR